jgi:hypothetical protein
VDVNKIDNTLLEKTFQDIRASRKTYSPHASVWDLFLDWTKKQEILTKLHLGEYQFSTCHSYFKEWKWRSYWQAADVVLLKVISYLLKKDLLFSAFNGKRSLILQVKAVRNI